MILLIILDMKLYFFSMLPSVIYNIGAEILRAVGDSKTPLYYLIVCSAVNVLFDFLLVANIKMGIAQFVCAVLVIIKLMRSKENYQLKLKEIKIDLMILIL